MRRAAVVLGGGRASRMGTDKLALTIDGRPLLERVVAAAATVADPVVVAGPQPPDWAGPEVVFAPEDPPFGGPVAGIQAALVHVGDVDEVLLLAGDLAAPAAAVAVLCELEPGPDGVIFVDADGRRQTLLGRYRPSSLRGALESLAEVRGAPLGRLLHSLRLAEAPAGAFTDDVDTPEDATRLGARMHDELR